MRIYRWIILAVLAVLTVLLLGTAVLAYQMPAPLPAPSQQQPLGKPDNRQKAASPVIELIVADDGATAVTAVQLLNHSFCVPQGSANHLRRTNHNVPVSSTAPDTMRRPPWLAPPNHQRTGSAK
ncbi:MAG: hypothetical protein IPM39_05535 [Chloroflexi bacterium]|nr:hypothetical protein [Chloroflexota bacterium]